MHERHAVARCARPRRTWLSGPGGELVAGELGLARADDLPGLHQLVKGRPDLIDAATDGGLDRRRGDARPGRTNHLEHGTVVASVTACIVSEGGRGGPAGAGRFVTFAESLARTFVLPTLGARSCARAARTSRCSASGRRPQRRASGGARDDQGPLAARAVTSSSRSPALAVGRGTERRSCPPAGRTVTRRALVAWLYGLAFSCSVFARYSRSWSGSPAATAPGAPVAPRRACARSARKVACARRGAAATAA
jgi:hypothetical protein